MPADLDNEDRRPPHAPDQPHIDSATDYFGTAPSAARQGESIIRTEQQWRRAPPGLLHPDGREARISASRWEGTIVSAPLEASTNRAAHHLVSMVMRKGKTYLSLNGRTIADRVLLPGETLLTGPGLDRARAVYYQDFEIVRLHLPQAIIAEVVEHITGTAASGGVELFEHHETHDQVIHHLTMSVVNFADEGSPLGPIFLDSVGLTLTTHLVSQSAGKGTSTRIKKASPLPQWRLKRVMDYVEEHLAREISLAELGAVAGLSRMHFATQFRAATGMSPHAYILHRRVSRSKQLLAESELSIQEIAHAIGFKTQSHFINVFRRMVGEAPGRWRQLVR